MRNIIRLVIISMLWLSSAHAMTVPEEITQEATSPNSDTNHPLPLMATWATGRVWDDQTASTQLTYTPTWQIRMIQQGHHLLPSFFMPDWTMLDPAQSANGSLNWPTYYQWPIQQAAAMNLPLTFIGTQWEQELYKDTNWFNLPAAQNPNVINPSTGSPQATLSAFGPVLPWQDVGAKWISATNQVGGTSMLAYLQQWYPNPPLVQFLSNNEAQRETASPIAGTEVENDQHYLDTWGTGHTPIFKREKLADGWTARYRSMQDSMRAQLINSTWKDNARFIAYNAFGPPHFGRWSGWMDYSQYITNRIDANPLAWDGGSPSYYLGEGGWDFQVYGPQVEAMNYDFMLKEAYALNPDFWFELSVWSGCDYWPLSAAPANDASAQTLIKTIPDYTPTRYGGMVQFGMWLTRPRVVRNFTAQVSKLADSEAFFDVLMDNVDKVYVNATLKTFWRSSDLVANTTRQHPYQTAIPLEYKSTNRMFMLTTTLDPPLPWDLKTELPVFALARVKGVAPSRQWLAYTFSPQQDRTNVQITIPNYNKVITANPTIAGSFLLVDEASGSVTSVNNDASLSDLVISSVSGPNSGMAGTNITVTTTTTNTGNTAALATVTALYLSSDPTITSADIPLWNISVGSLTPGTGSTNTTQVTLPSTLVSGVYYLGAIADANNVVMEGNSAGTGESNNVKAGSVIQINGVPAAPSALSASATVNSRTKITLKWTDNASDESGFKIERSPDGLTTTFIEVAKVGSATTTYTNSRLKSNTLYYYRVRAYNNRGNSTYSNTVSVRTNP